MLPKGTAFIWVVQVPDAPLPAAGPIVREVRGAGRFQIRKVTKNKGVFTSDMALLKLIYLATERIARKWTMPLQSWAISASQLKIIFGDRMKTDL